MKSIGELTEITQVSPGGVFAVNNAQDTVSNKITIENLTSQIVDAVEHDVNLAITDSSSSNTDNTATNGNVHINLIENGTVDSTHTITGSGSTSVTSDSNGDITISGLELGETSSTAYRGDRGKEAYDHSQATHARTDATKTEASSTNGNIKINGTETTVYTHPGSGTNPHGTTASDVGLGNVGNFKAVSTVASQGLTDTEKSNARTNIGAGTSSLIIGTTASTAAAGNHTHTTTIAADSGTSSLSLAANTKYKLTTGETSFIFTTPADSDTKNTAGSTDTSSKIFLVGATSQAANPQTYSDNQVYTTSGTLTSNKLSTKALVALTGSGTAGSDKGSGVSPRYIPTLWTFNSGITVSNGEVYLIKIPIAGGTYGVWLSLNNGTNYYPVAISSGKGRFTTHYAANTVIAVTYESAGICNCYAKAGADATAEVTGIFRVLNDYDSGNTNTYVTQTASTGNADYEVLFSATADNTTRTEGARKNSNLLFNPSTGNLQTTQLNGVTIGSSPKFTDTTYSSKTAASGGTDVSLVTTGEKYTWNNKSTLAIGTTASTAAAGNHTHGLSIAADSGTNALTLAASTKYKLTAGGNTFIFTTPPNTTYSSKTAASGGTDVSLVTTGEKYTWNNKSTLAIGTTASTAAAGNHTHGLSIAADSGTSSLTMAANTKYKLTAGGSTYIFTTPPATDSTKLPLAGGTMTGRITSAKPNKMLVTGSGTAAQDKGSGVSPRYFPAKWTFNTGITAADGDMITIKIPCAGHSYGVFMSIDNGTKYYPVVCNGTARLTTHYGNGTYITVQFESGGSAADMYALAGADARATVTDGVWRVINFYDSNSNTIPSAYCDTAAATAAKTASCSGYSLLSKSFIHVIVVNTNTSASAITLNINGKGAKPIYINGSASSSSNYSLTAGSYLVYYNGTNYYFRTDGKLTADITGNAANVTGTVAIANGGTGATTRLNAVKALTNEDVGTSATYFLTITNSWGKAGYTSVANAKTVLGLGSAAYTASTAYATSDHTHTLSIAADSGTNALTLAASTKYKLTAGGKTFIFTTPPNTTYSSKTAASGGTDVSLCTTGEKYTWNNKSTVPTSHASTATTYGVGNASNYGHVKLSDTYASNVGAAANAIGASQTALFNAFSKAYGTLQWQHLSSYGGGATCPIVKNATYVGAGSDNLSAFMAFKCGRIGMVVLAFRVMKAIPIYTDIVIASDIDFTPAIPMSGTSIGNTAATYWGSLYCYDTGCTYPANIVHNDAGTKSVVKFYVCGANPIAVNNYLYGSMFCITDS